MNFTTVTPPNYKPIPEGVNPQKYVHYLAWHGWLMQRKRLREARPEVLERLEAIRQVERERRAKECQDEIAYWKNVELETGNCNKYGN